MKSITHHAFALAKFGSEKAITCTAHHMTFGGLCLNCGFKPVQELPAFKVTRSDGSSYVTSMAIGVTLKEARNYFIGATFCDEDSSGKEHHWTATAVELA